MSDTVICALAPDGDTPYWKPYEDIVDPGFTRYMEAEAEATHVWTYTSSVVPGLLQTTPYMQRVMAPFTTHSEADKLRLQQLRRERRMRQFHRLPAPLLQFVVEEAVLHHSFGGDIEDDDALAAQLTHIVNLVEKGVVRFRILPFTADCHLLVGRYLTVMHLPAGRTAFSTDAATVTVTSSATPALRDAVQAQNRVTEAAWDEGTSLHVLKKFL